MEATLKPVLTLAGQSILVKNDKMEQFYAPIHYHPEYEIIYIKKSNGIRIIGNDISNYLSGEVVVLGPGLPHYHEVGAVEALDKTPIETIAVLFPESIFETNIKFPEIKSILKTLEDIKFGVELEGALKIDVQDILETMTLEPSIRNFINIFSIMETICKVPNSYRTLSTVRYDNKRVYNDKTRHILDYLSEHYLEKIGIADMALRSNLSKTAFCNFFKSQTGVAFSQYLNSLRISKASELLITSKKHVSEIAFEVGFENLGYFNRKFLEIKKRTPSQFRRDFISQEII